MMEIDTRPARSDWCQRVRRWDYVDGTFQQVAGCLCTSSHNNPESHYGKSAVYRRALARTEYTDGDLEEVRRCLARVRDTLAIRLRRNDPQVSLGVALTRVEIAYRSGREPDPVGRLPRQRSLWARELIERASYELYTAIPLSEQPDREVATFSSVVSSYALGEDLGRRIALVDTALVGLIRSQAPLHGTR